MTKAADYSFPQKVWGGLITTLDLMVARIVLSRTTPNRVLARNRRALARAASTDLQPHPAIIAQNCDRVAFFVSAMARRVPWRSDCLVQALAGQAALLRRGIPSEIIVGTARDSDGSFEAHAWLKHRETIILGGNVEKFSTMLALPGVDSRPK